MEKFILVGLDDNLISELLKAGLIEPVDSKPKEKENTNTIPMDIEYYIKKVADRTGWDAENLDAFLGDVDNIYHVATLSIILREIAIELDKKYKDHISDSPEIYVISTLNGKITKANKASIKNYRNFAAFRTIEDAKIACRITRDILKDMFKSGK